MNDSQFKPVQMTLGIRDEEGAAFLGDDEIKIIGDAAHCDSVLQVAYLCDGTRNEAEIIAAAGRLDIEPALAKLILETLTNEAIVRDSKDFKRNGAIGELQQANQLLTTYVGAEKLISDLEVYKPGRDDEADETLPYFVANGHFKFCNGQPYTCHGSGPTALQAVLKSIGEGVERYYNGAGLCIDAFCRADHLPHAYQVFESVIYQQETYLQERGFLKFSPDDEHPWVLAQHLTTQRPVYVLPDTVYYPLTAGQLKRPKVSQVLASGSAAHFDRDEAIKRGFFEIIERDAIAVTWHAKRPVTAIPIVLAPPDIQERIDYWAEQGRDFKLLNVTVDSIPVVLVMSEGDQYPFITAGCAAAETYSAAIEKAFLESEIISYSWAKNPHPAPALTVDMSPQAHGSLYANPGNEHRVDWLLDAPEAEPEERQISLSDLYDRFEPLVVDLHRPQSGSDLWVVKVLSDNVLPLTFGYKSEPYGHSRLQKLGLPWQNYPNYPHFLA